MARRTVTMRDVAERAGVAVSTVSRVISTPERISVPTREAVLLAARELGYGVTPSPPPETARGAVALLVPDVRHPFYFDIIRGCQSRLRAAGYLQVLVDTEESADLEVASLGVLVGACAGAVLTAPRMTDDALRETAGRFPVVAINRRVPGVRSVVMDTRPAVEQAVEHLASLGHRRVCYVAGPDSSWASRERWRGCEDAGRRLGLEVVRVGPYVPRRVSAPAAADAFLHTGATAAVAFNDLLAIGMVQRLADRGVAVPGDVSVVGCDDIFGADFCTPPLTTLTSPMVEAGQRATTLLLDQIGVHDLSARGTTALPVHLTIRGTTGPASTAAAAARTARASGQTRTLQEAAEREATTGPEDSRTTT